LRGSKALTISRIYLPREIEIGEVCELTGENRKYVLSVLRMKKGNHLLLFDGLGCECEAVITGHDHERVNLKIISKEVVPAEAINITLAQSLPKAKKMDSIIEKACELGTFRIIPFVSARSIPRLPPEKALLKQARWQKIALEAARTCHLNRIPEVGNIHAFEKMLREADTEALKIIFWEEETKRSLKQTLEEIRPGASCNLQLEKCRDFFLVVGPEGGFAEDEIRLAESRGFTSVSLGRQILKVETAAIVILSIIQYERGAFGVTK